MTDSLIIPARFCGPPGTGNGGYVCGRIAGYIDGPVTVTLRRPPPLATPLTLERCDVGSVNLRQRACARFLSHRPALAGLP